MHLIFVHIVSWCICTCKYEQLQTFSILFYPSQTCGHRFDEAPGSVLVFVMCHYIGLALKTRLDIVPICCRVTMIFFYYRCEVWKRLSSDACFLYIVLLKECLLSSQYLFSSFYYVIFNKHKKNNTVGVISLLCIFLINSFNMIFKNS